MRPYYFCLFEKNKMKNNSNESKNDNWWRPGLFLFSKLSVWIVTPVLISTFLGKYLDKRLDSEPLMLIIVVGIGFFVSIFGLVKETIKEYKKIEKDLNNKKTHINNNSNDKNRDNEK